MPPGRRLRGNRAGAGFLPCATGCHLSCATLQQCCSPRAGLQNLWRNCLSLSSSSQPGVLLWHP